MPYIDTKYLFRCETCRHCVGDIKCNTFCDSGECYSTSMSKIPTADVVPRAEVERLRFNLKAVLEERAEDKAEVAREIFAKLREKGKFNEPIVPYICLSFDELAEIEMKYTGETDTNDGHKTGE